MQRLGTILGGTFYRESFSRLEGDILAALYSEKPSRPDISVNVLVGFKALEAGFRYIDEEMYAAHT